MINVVIDPSILLGLFDPKQKELRREFFSSKYQFFLPLSFKEFFFGIQCDFEKMFVGVSPKEVQSHYNKVFDAVSYVDEELIEPQNWKKALFLCKDVDSKDSLLVALAFHVDGLYWSLDRSLKRGLEKKLYNRFF